MNHLAYQFRRLDDSICVMSDKLKEEQRALGKLDELFKRNNAEYSRLEKTWNEVKHERPEFEKKYTELSRYVSDNRSEMLVLLFPVNIILRIQ